jgi:hypothetical protein
VHSQAINLPIKQSGEKEKRIHTRSARISDVTFTL